MSASKVAIRYARAFVDALQEKDRLDDHRSLLDFIALVEKSPQLGDLFDNVSVKPSSKADVLKAVAAKVQLPDLVERFLLVLAENRRLSVLSEVGRAVAGLIDQRLNIRAVDLTTATAMGEKELKAFSEAMGRSLGAKVRVKTTVDPEILGGAVARVGSFVYDGSVRGQLARLRRQLVKES